jgi:hypothetical protein
MKSLKISLMSVAVITLAMASCKSGLTPEEIEKKATEQFEAQKSALTTEATEACNAQKDMLVKNAVDSIYQAEVAKTLPVGK